MNNRLLYFSVLSVLILSSGALAAQNNLLVNPGFEEGTYNNAPPWGVGGWRGTVRATKAESHSGRRSLMLEGGGDEGGINSAVQIVPIDPTGATKYKMRAWIKVPSGTGSGRMRWYFSDGSNGGFVTPIAGTDWMQIDQGENDIIPGAGATHMIWRIYFLAGQPAAFLDDCELVPEPSGNPTYPGVKGTVKDSNGNPVAGAVVFLKGGPKAQEFAGSSAVSDAAGNFIVCTKDDGAYSVVAWKQGYALSEEKEVTIATGAELAAFNPVLTKGSGGRNLAISTAARPTAFSDIDVGRFDDPQFKVSYLFDGNTITTRYYNNAKAEPADERWVYVDLDPVGKGTFTINEFVLHSLGITLMTQGWPGSPADLMPKDFAIEYTTKDPATETEDGWKANVAFSATDAAAVLPPVVLRLQNPITARAVRLHVITPTGNSFGPLEFEVNSDKLSRGTITGVVKDATTGAPIPGARVSLFQLVNIQSDPDIYGLGNPVPFVVAEEERNGTPYEYPQAKNTEQIATTDANGNYTLDANPGLPVRVTASVTGYPYTTVSVTPPDDGSPAKQDFSLGKEYSVSGVVKDSTGPLYNAIVQIGGANSPEAAVTDVDGKFGFLVGAGSHEVYADAYGHAGKVETITVSADVTKDITLDTQAESAGLNADFETLDGWEIGQFDTEWKSVGTLAAVVDGSQNTTPGGKSSALVEDVMAVDSTGKELDNTYQMLQRTSSKRIAVESGKSYNVYFKAKSENWVSPEHRDTCHFEVLWLDTNGAVLARVYSHPHWINPQPFWQQYSRGHPAGSAGSVALVRLAPPAGAAWLDLKIGWIRNPSGITEDNPAGTNPAGSKLFVDDLVIDAFGSGGGQPQPTISAAKDPGGIKVTWTGVLESTDTITGPWSVVPGATSPLVIAADRAQRFLRSRSQ